MILIATLIEHLLYNLLSMKKFHISLKVSPNKTVAQGLSDNKMSTHTILQPH